MVDIDALMSHASFVRTLSRRLVMDEHYAEDAVQETFLRALERPPHASGALRTWLATVCRNFILSSYRNDNRRVLRERKAFKKDVAPTPGEIVEHETVRRSVVKALIALDRIYRDPIMLKYYEDMPPRKIARRLNIPVETVRTRIRRGLSLMRNALDIDYGGDGRSWFVALLPVAGFYTKAMVPGTAGLVTESVGKLLFWMIGKPIGSLAALLCCATIILSISLINEMEAWDSKIDSLDIKNAKVQAATIVNQPAGNKEVIEKRTTSATTYPPMVPQTEKTSVVKKGTRRHYPSSMKNMGQENQRGMELVPAGETWLGLDVDEVVELSEGQKAYLDSLSRSIPKHKVSVDAFYCDVYEVTNKQWAHYLECTYQNPSFDIMQFAWKENTEPPKDEEDFPVRNVSLMEARAFARWCGKRIPTEREWMRAAAGDEERKYAWGDYWRSGRYCTNRRHTLSPVGSYRGGKSYFNIHDMTGSVWEWTDSKFVAYPGYAPASIVIGQKTCLSEPGFNPDVYVIKGGHYLAGELANLLAVREPLSMSSTQSSVGLRCVKDAQRGKTLFRYAKEDLSGSCMGNYPFDIGLAYCMEKTDSTTQRSLFIRSYDYFLVIPIKRSNKTVREIEADAKKKPEPFGVLSTNRYLAKPDLPPGSYLLAYCPSGFSFENIASSEKRRVDRQRTEEKLYERFAADKTGRLLNAAKNIKEIDEERRCRELIELLKKEETEFLERQEKRNAQLYDRFLITNAKESIWLPSGQDMVVFMNANNEIVGYVEAEGLYEDEDEIRVAVAHESMSTQIEMGFEGPHDKFSWLRFAIEIEGNPFF